MQAFTELLGILGESYRSGALWLLIAVFPWAVTLILRLYRGARSWLYRSCLLASAVALLCWLWKLGTLGPTSPEATVNAWYLHFLYFSVPVWLMFWSVFGAGAFVYWKVVGVDDEETDQDG